MANRYAEIIDRLGGQVNNPREPLSDEQIGKMEAWLGYALPTDYREFARYYVEVGLHTAHHRDGTIDMLYGLTAPTPELLVQNPDQLRRELHGQPAEIEWAPNVRTVIDIPDDAIEVDYPPRELLLIGVDAGGNEIYLALAGLRPGSVFFWRLWNDISQIADSFDDFMNSLS